MENLIRFFRTTLGHSKITIRLLAFNFLVGTLPLLLIGLWAVQKMDSLVKQEVQASQDQVVSLYAANLGFKLRLYSTIVFNLSSNRNLVEAVSRPVAPGRDFEVGRTVSNEISSQVGSQDTSELRNAVFYSFDEVPPLVGTRISSLASARNEGWFSKMRGGGYVDEVFLYHSPGVNRDVLCLIRPVADLLDAREGRKLGFLKIDLDWSNLLTPGARAEAMGRATIVVYDQAGVILTDPAALAAVAPGFHFLTNDVNAVTRLRNQLGDQALVSGSAVAQTPWSVAAIFSTNELSKRSGDIEAVVLGLLLVSALIMGGLAVYLSRTLAYRLGLLIAKMERVEGGNLVVVNHLGGNDELATVDAHFNKMVDTLGEVIQSNYIEKLERKQAELSALQFQINPHFLYNTLESINTLARTGRTAEIGEVTQRLGAMFRYNTGSPDGDWVLLAEELAQTDNYIAIQNLRFSGRFQYFVDAEIDVARFSVLKFILQPLVENAVIHGLEPKAGPGVIEVAIRTDGKHLTIRVGDDGVGIPADALRRLRKALNDSGRPGLSGHLGVGLVNVHRRLRLAHGPEAGLSIDSLVGQGTFVTIRVPRSETGSPLDGTNHRTLDEVLLDERIDQDDR